MFFWCSGDRFAGTMSCGFPSVMVPVLSNIITLALANFWSASAFFIKTPCSAPFPNQAMTAIGVASHNPQGQAITSTPINHIIPNLSASSNHTYFVPMTNRPISDNIAIPTTTGINIADTLSTILWSDVLLFCACSTKAIILANIVDDHTAVAWIVRTP